MNKALIPAFFLLGSLLLGVSVMIPQFTYAQGEQTVNDQQMQALKLFFNEQNMQNTHSNDEAETLSSQSFDDDDDETSQQALQQMDDSSQSSGVQSQNVAPNRDNDNQQDMQIFSNGQCSTTTTTINK